MLFSIALACVLVTSGAHANSTYTHDTEYLIESFNTDDGLAENSLNGLAQTSDGYLWIAMNNSVVQYDGAKFSLVSLSEELDRSPRGITALHVDRAGRVWMGTRLGLARRSGKDWRVLGFGSDTNGWGATVVRSFAEDSKGKIYVTTFADEVWECVGDVLRKLPRPHGTNGFASVCMDTADNLWVAHGDFFGRWDGRWWNRVTDVTQQSARPLELNCAAARQGGVWLLASNVLRRIQATGEVSRTVLPGLRGNTSSVFEDSRGQVWISSSDNGLYRVRNGEVRRWSRSNGLPDNNIRGVFEDAEQNLWVATIRAGLVRFTERPFRSFFTMTNGAEFGRFSVAASPTGGVFITRYGGQLVRASSSGSENVQLPSAVQGAMRAAESVLVDRNGDIWLGSHNQGAWRISGNHFVNVPVEEPHGGTVSALFEDSRGTVWIAGGRAVASFTAGKTTRYSEAQGLPRNSVYGFAEDAHGAIWLAHRDGVFRKEGERFAEMRDGDGRSIRAQAVYADSEGAIWMGSLRNIFLRTSEGRIVRGELPSHLPSRGAMNFIEDSRGSMWMALSRGILRARTSDLKRWLVQGGATPVMQAFDLSDGLPSLFCSVGYQPTVARDTDGKLWFATRQGVAMVNPANLPLNPLPPPVHIEELSYYRASNRAYSDSETQSLKSHHRAPWPEKLVLPAGSRRLEINYTACTFSAPSKTRFQIKLGGGESEWQDVGNRRSAYLYDLSPGDYVFKVRAANGHGVWNEAGASLAITVAPFFWQTIWFRVVSALALLTAGAGGGLWIARMRARHARMETERREISGKLITAQEDERKRIARDLHDDLNQRLALLSVELELLGRETDAGGPVAQARLEEMAEGVKELSSDVHKMSYQLHPAKLEQLGLVAAARTFCRELQRQSGVRIDFVHDEISRDLDAGVALCLYRVLQESLQNAVRHSGAGEVQVELRLKDARVHLVVSDRGRGFDVAAAELRGGLGLISMRERVRQVGGELLLDTSVRGTRIEVLAPCVLRNSAAF